MRPRRSRRRAAALGLSVLVGLSACSEPPKPEGTARAVDSGGEPDSVSVPIRTTDATIAETNLDFSIDRARALAAARPRDPLAARGLIDLLLTRVQFRNSFEDYDEALAVAERLIQQSTDPAEAHVLLADVLTTLHRYGEACEQLRLAAATLKPDELAPRAWAISIASGHAGSVIDAVRREALETPGYAVLSRLAAAEGEIGELVRADAAYVQALEHYEGTSPHAVAWVQYQRSRLWTETAPELAERLLRDALTRLPDYVNANVKLAELEAGSGRTDDALQRLAAMAALTDDPDVRSVLAQLLLAEDEADRAAPLIDEAERGFRRLIQRHRLAFADHAAEFFAGPGGDLDLARELADDAQTTRSATCSLERANQ